MTDISSPLPKTFRKLTSMGVGDLKKGGTGGSTIQSGITYATASEGLTPNKQLGNFSLPESEDGLFLGPTLFQRMVHRADRFREFLSGTICGCLSSIPSFALIIIAMVLILMLIASIPLAFILTYHPSALSTDKANREKVPELVHRYHSAWPNATVNMTDPSSIKMSALIPPNVTTCHGYGFSCTSTPGHVIGTNQRCDGVYDCIDKSDEFSCGKCQTSFTCPIKDSKRKVCLRGASICDGAPSCDNGEDEQLYCRDECTSKELKCSDKKMCVPQEMVCDGDFHCPNGDDEKGCSECKGGAMFCEPSGKCIPKWKLCDGKKDCDNGVDEMDCDCSSCSGYHKALCKGNQNFCIEKRRLCDGVNDCPEGEDEQSCPGNCPRISQPTDTSDEQNSPDVQNVEMVRCADGKEYPWRYACDGSMEQCRHSCNDCNPELTFQCGSNINNPSSIAEDSDSDGEHEFKECIARGLICDGKQDCFDGSDEFGCDCEPLGDRKLCSAPADMMKSLYKPKCYTKAQECDGYKDCHNGDDETGCNACSENSFSCKSGGQCVPSSTRCDGRTDCSDGSDEEDCTCKECSQHPFPMFKCSGTDRCFRISEVCQPKSLCPNETRFDRLFCAFRKDTAALRLI